MQVQIHPSAIGWEGLYPLARKASNKVRALPLIETILHVPVNATRHCRHSMDATNAEVNTSVADIPRIFMPDHRRDDNSAIWR